MEKSTESTWIMEQSKAMPWSSYLRALGNSSGSNGYIICILYIYICISYVYIYIILYIYIYIIYIHIYIFIIYIRIYIIYIYTYIHVIRINKLMTIPPPWGSNPPTTMAHSNDQRACVSRFRLEFRADDDCTWGSHWSAGNRCSWPRGLWCLCPL